MERIPRTATVAITAITALAWLVATAGRRLGSQAALALGFIPARFSGLVGAVAVRCRRS